MPWRDADRAARMRSWVLLAAIVVAATILAIITYRTTWKLDALRASATFEVTLGLADEKVDRVDRAIVESDDAVVQLGEPSHADEVPRRWRALGARLTPTVSQVVVLDASSAREVVAFASRAPGPADDGFRAMLLRRILPDLEVATLPLSEIKHLHRAYDGTFVLLTYWRAIEALPDGRQAERLVLVRHDLEAIARELLPQVVPDPGSPDPTSRVNVVDDDGKVVFGPPLNKSDLLVAVRFPTTLYAWRLQVAPASGDELTIQARRRRLGEMALLALSCVVVLAGVVVVLLANAQERKLHAMRADFVANVSHELKTPLALVRMFGELLMTGRVANEEKRTQYLQIIVRESERLTALIENVLDFARVEKGKVAYDFAPGDLGGVVARAVEACRYRAETEGMRLEIDAAPELPEVVMDERAMQLVVINLVENALKYAPGTEVVRVEVGGHDDVATIAVIDRGPGIAEGDRERIFERFYRGKSARGGQVRGSGIGLALVDHIADAHGGRVEVRDGEKGKGAVFVVTLPVRGPKRRRGEA
jgi:two-component system phosphate regulon sensor histidine kinase PhoR